MTDKAGDLLEDLLKNEPSLDTDNPTKDLPSNEDVDALKEQIAALEKKKQGLLQGVKDERRKRQEISGRLNQLTETVNGILSQRNAAADAINTHTADSTAKRGIPVTHTEDGESFVDPAEIQKIIDPYQTEINELKQQLQLVDTNATAEQEADKVRSAIIGEDERFFTANSKYQTARKWVLDQVEDFSRQNGINHQITSGQALDYVFNKELQTEFGTKFPGMDMVDVVTAEDSQHHFRQMLTHIAEAKNPLLDENRSDTNRVDNRFQKVLNKPSGLGDQANAKAGVLSISEKMADISPEAIMSLTDAQAEALERALLEEEKMDGVKF
ncbi:MAG: hypothetical protein ACYTEO_14165 [Planctomycetota bacterium]|jgi:vacuolar-type H+-ATPase subunit I/STV1